MATFVLPRSNTGISRVAGRKKKERGMCAQCVACIRPLPAWREGYFALELSRAPRFCLASFGRACTSHARARLGKLPKGGSKIKSARGTREKKKVRSARKAVYVTVVSACVRGETAAGARVPFIYARLRRCARPCDKLRQRVVRDAEGKGRKKESRQDIGGENWNVMQRERRRAFRIKNNPAYTKGV